MRTPRLVGSTRARLLLAMALVLTAFVALRMATAANAALFNKAGASAQPSSPQPQIEDRFFAGPPQSREDSQVSTIHHLAYSVGYSETRKTPLWSAYVTFRTDAIGPSFGKHRPRWQAEAGSTSGVVPRDIDGLPWHGEPDSELSSVRIDKGHLTPLSDIAYRYGLKAAEETFRMGNAVPQLSSNNQGAWELLEASVSGINRNGHYVPGAVDTEGRLWIITGPVFKGAPSWSKGHTALPSGIPIPSMMYKVVVGGTLQKPKILCLTSPRKTRPRIM